MDAEIVLDEVSDYRLQSFYKNILSHTSKDVQRLLFPQMKCGTAPIQQAGSESGVFLLSGKDISTNEIKSRFFGMMSCNNPWSCPYCSAKRMAEYANRIAKTITALKEQHLVSFMATFTIPHIKLYTCEDVTKILIATQKDFLTYRSNLSSRVARIFKNTLQIKYYIRVAEYTWGKNGWHPHYHVLYFVPEKNLQLVLDHVETIRQTWLKIARKNTIKHFTQKRPDIGLEKITLWVDSIFKACERRQPGQGFVVSTTNIGQVREQKSSMYICGWGADRELTGNYVRKASHDGHYTPYQILSEAYKTDSDKFKSLYLEYAVTTRKYFGRRYSSSVGLTKLIRAWEKTASYTEYSKKKFTYQKVRDWHVVCWFNELQWLQISVYDNAGYELKAEILRLSKFPDARLRIKEFLSNYDIRLPEYDHPLTQHIENNIFNRAA